MRLHHAPKRTGPAARGSFTMVELIIVLMVISILVALTAGTVFRVILSQKKSNTKVTIDKISSQLTKQWNTYKDLFWKEDAPRNFPNQWNYVLTTLAQNDPKRARVIWVKLRMKQVFPVNFNEAITPVMLGTYPLLAVPAYVTALQQIGINTTNVPAAAAAANYESSACLLMALQQSPSGGGANLEALGIASSTKSFAITNVTGNTNSVLALADEWGSPLQFCRWPYLYARLGNTLNGQPGAANDPGDPEGTLTVQSWLSSTGLTQFQALCHPVPNRSGTAPNTQPMSNKLVPVVVSAGPDKKLGLDPTGLSVNQSNGDENDNLDNVP
jgi:type II secretory pathway pseudopilin PulG